MSEPLAVKQTALVRGTTDTKMGRLAIFEDRLAFFDQKFMPGVTGGALGAGLALALQQGHEAGGPLLEIPFTSITAFRRARRLLNKDRIELDTTDGGHLFNDGWRDLSPVLRDALAAAGRAPQVDGDDGYRVPAG